MRETLRDAAQVEERRFSTVHTKIEDSEKRLGAKIDQAIAAATAGGLGKVDWKTVGTIVTLVVAPIVAAILGTK